MLLNEIYIPVYIKKENQRYFVIMVLIAANPRGTKSVYRSNSIPASLNDNLDDVSVAVTVKQSNVTIEVRTTSINTYSVLLLCCTRNDCAIKSKTNDTLTGTSTSTKKNCSF